MGFLGASGCGKSMTLKCIAGIETPDEGRIVLNDRVLFDSEKKVNLSPQKRKVGYLFQQYALFPHMTVRQNVEAGLSGSGRTFSSGKEKNAFVERLLEQFHIPELADALPARLSGGQQQRVALVRILASKPQAILLDEPFSALDSSLKLELELELESMLEGFGGTVLWVSHDRSEVERHCRQVAVMESGNVGRVTTPGGAAPKSRYRGRSQNGRMPESYSVHRLERHPPCPRMGTDPPLPRQGWPLHPGTSRPCPRSGGGSPWRGGAQDGKRRSGYGAAAPRHRRSAGDRTGHGSLSSHRQSPLPGRFAGSLLSHPQSLKTAVSLRRQRFLCQGRITSQFFTKYSTPE